MEHAIGFNVGIPGFLAPVIAPLHALVGFFAPWSLEASSSARASESKESPRGMHSPSAQLQHTVQKPASVRPLRVVRVIDQQSPCPASAGRIRISGLLEDVCAELDRLACEEARQSARRSS